MAKAKSKNEFFKYGWRFTKGARGLMLLCTIAVALVGAAFLLLAQAQIRLVDVAFGVVEGNLLYIGLFLPLP